MPRHHPELSLLTGFASGACGTGESLLLASHISLCGDCTNTLQTLEALGGVLLEEQPAAPLPQAALDRLLERLDEQSSPQPSVAPATTDIVFPAPLRPRKP